MTRIETPTPYPIGPVNAYLIRAEPVTLVDSGLGTDESRFLLIEGISEAGLRLGDIERILVTHGHPDHYGLVHDIAELSGAQIYFPAKELPRLTGGRALLEAWGRLLIEAGMPMEALLEMDERRRSQPRPRLEPDEVTPVEDGDRFGFEGFELVTCSSPGHTGGHVVYLEPARRVLLAGDQLLPDVSPNPLLEPSVDEPGVRRRSLLEYLDSLEKMAAMDLVLAYPGHGQAVTDPSALIKRTIAHHLRRKRRVAAHLDATPRSPFELARVLYPNVVGNDVFLAVSEVVAHLDLVVEDRLAEVRHQDGIALYCKHPHP